ncbi:MAG TPA: hypothetical protein VNC78_06125 [Actinomycetota bacterium]|nr:hypothetical protein [Actinomycetota bacterium]
MGVSWEPNPNFERDLKRQHEADVAKLNADLNRELLDLARTHQNGDRAATREQVLAILGRHGVHPPNFESLVDDVHERRTS